MKHIIAKTDEQNSIDLKKILDEHEVLDFKAAIRLSRGPQIA